MHEMIAQLCEDESSQFFLDLKPKKSNWTVELYYFTPVTDMVSDETAENMQLS